MVVRRGPTRPGQDGGGEAEAQLQGPGGQGAQVDGLMSRGPGRDLHRGQSVRRRLVHVGEERLVSLLGGPGRDVGGDEALGGLLQLPGRLPPRVPRDVAVRRVRGLPGDARDLQRLRVREPHVAVALAHVDRPVRDHGVDVLLVRGRSGKAA